MLDPNSGFNRIAIMKQSTAVTYRATPYKMATKPRHFAFLARLCWKLLHRLGALETFQERIETFTYTEAHQKSITELMGAAYEVSGYHDVPFEDLAYIMGADDFGAVAKRADIAEWGMFTVHGGEFHYRTDYRTDFYGVPVHVVPWLKGIAIVPKVLIEVRKEVAA